MGESLPCRKETGTDFALSGSTSGIFYNIFPNRDLNTENDEIIINKNGVVNVWGKSTRTKKGIQDGATAENQFIEQLPLIWLEDH